MAAIGGAASDASAEAAPLVVIGGGGAGGAPSPTSLGAAAGGSGSSSFPATSAAASAPAAPASSAAASTPAVPGAPPSALQVASVVVQFGVASITMVAGNKAAVKHFPLPCTLVVVQALGTIALLLAFFRASLAPVTPALVREWLPISALFTLMLFTSMQSFVHSGVSTILILRNVGAIVTTGVEYFVRGTTANAGTYASEVVIVVGAVLYTGGAVDATPLGLFWILSNVCAQVAYGVLLKHKMDTSPAIKDLTSYTMSMLNNALAVPMVLLVLFIEGEHSEAADVVAAATPLAWGLVLLTCVFGFVISTSGFALQKLVSAATFLVINNLAKFVNILIGVYVLQERVVGWNGVGGCVLALAGGAWYSYEQMKLKAAVSAKPVK
jgi:drug/metabolite transporter (DMT)-like permease